MGQIEVEFKDLKESLREIGEENLTACFSPEEISEMCRNLGVRAPLDKVILSHVLSEKEHIGGRSKDVHTMSLLYGSFFGKQGLSEPHLDIMKALQGFEVEALIVDKAIDDPRNVRDLDMRTLSSRVLYSAMTNRFYEAMEKLPIDDRTRVKAMEEWNKTSGHLYAGQGHDVLATRFGLPLAFQDYLHIVENSTSEFVRLALILGALNSGKCPEEIDKIRAYGKDLGIAFQIRDDWRDFYSDILEGKHRIFTTREALQGLNDSERRFVCSKLHLGEQSEKVARIISSSNSPEYAMKMNSNYVNLAKDNLKGLSGNYVTRLEDVAETLRVDANYPLTIPEKTSSMHLDIGDLILT